ncbi:hypothetical protein IG631_10371 [Alternaria alternata]|nr:hypothetical protein IG631_10371 [Alternaria alternata]
MRAKQSQRGEGLSFDGSVPARETAGVESRARARSDHRLAGSDQQIGQARPREREGASYPCANHGGAGQVAPLP